jgi:uncharacterized protein YacL
VGRPASTTDRSRLDLAGIIYGIILATALISAFSEEDKVGPVATFLAVMVTAVVFWLAHAYAQLLATGLVFRGGITRASLREALVREFPLVAGALMPALCLLATPLRILSEESAESLAIFVGVALLAAFGFIAARRQGAGVLGTIVLTLVSAALGLVLVGLKSLIH